MDTTANPSQKLASSITRSASLQTYLTIRYFVDRELVADAYRSYAYFRWVDDCLDENTLVPKERIAFLDRQRALLAACYQGIGIEDVSPEESMLVDLVQNHPQRGSGLELYLRNMMAVMQFDLKRRGRMVSQAELSQYTRLLATAVTEALHYFIGHDCPSPHGDNRYLAVQGAHIVHMLRDYQEDIQVGYINIPIETVQEHDLDLNDLDDPNFQAWVQSRLRLAETCFRLGREHIAQVGNLRCRLAGYAYLSRFEWMLQAIAADQYRLRATYPERKSWRAGLWVLRRTFSSAFLPKRRVNEPIQGVAPWRATRVGKEG
jgi:phytoene/squalene synthetase